MAKEIFVNLPVKDLKKTMTFFGQLGFEFNKQFTNDDAACMIVGENIYSMLLTEKFFQGFIPGKTISDAKKTTEVLVCISAESKNDVDSLVDKALKFGGTRLRDPEDHGFMYSRSFQDLDGHIWEVAYMDPNHIV